MARATLSAIDRWYAKTDSHRVIEVWKARVRGKPRGSLWPLHHQRTLGVCLLALGRVDEGLAVLDEAARSVRWTGKPSPWVIASWCAATAYWARLRCGETPAVEGLTRFGDHEGHAAIRLQPELWTRKRFADEIAESWQKFETGRADPGYLGVDTMAFHLSCVAFYGVLEVIAPVHRGKVKSARADASLAKALRAIEDRLELRWREGASLGHREAGREERRRSCGLPVGVLRAAGLDRATLTRAQPSAKFANTAAAEFPAPCRQLRSKRSTEFDRDR